MTHGFFEPGFPRFYDFWSLEDSDQIRTERQIDRKCKVLQLVTVGVTEASNI